MKGSHKRRLIIALVTLQLLFLIIFALAFYNQTQGHAIVAIGMPYAAINYIVMGFCVLSMINIVYELVKVR